MKIDLDTADLARDDLTQVRLWRHPDAPLLRRSCELRGHLHDLGRALRRSRREALGATLVTRDLRLARGVGAIGDVATAD